tara:strand:- start:109 stop:240 length:132 start_codon:yes stop_codon:yes gene_type:complete
MYLSQKVFVIKRNADRKPTASVLSTNATIAIEELLNGGGDHLI